MKSTNKDSLTDPRAKNDLQEYLVRLGHPNPQYEYEISTQGFRCTVRTKFGDFTGVWKPQKKDADKSAAAVALGCLQSNLKVEPTEKQTNPSRPSDDSCGAIVGWTTSVYPELLQILAMQNTRDSRTVLLHTFVHTSILNHLSVTEQIKLSKWLVGDEDGPIRNLDFGVLAVYGDAIVKLSITRHLMYSLVSPTKGSITIERAKRESREMMHLYMTDSPFYKCILTTFNKDLEHTSIPAEVFEALVGAIAIVKTEEAAGDFLEKYSVCVSNTTVSQMRIMGRNSIVKKIEPSESKLEEIEDVEELPSKERR